MFPFFFLLLVQPQAKGNPGCVCCCAAIGVKSRILPYCFSGVQYFSFDTQRGVYAPLFGSISGYLTYKKSCTHRFGFHPFILTPLLHPLHLSLLFLFPDLSISLAGSLSATPPFSLSFIMPLSNSPVVLVCVQVSHPTDPWGRCRCKWISSLTLALESTKSAWRVSFFLYSYLLFVIRFLIYSANIQRSTMDSYWW